MLACSNPKSVEQSSIISLLTGVDQLKLIFYNPNHFCQRQLAGSVSYRLCYFLILLNPALAFWCKDRPYCLGLS